MPKDCRPLHVIASLVRSEYEPTHRMIACLNNMDAMRSIKDYVGSKPGWKVVEEFLKSARGWRTPLAVEIKKELNASLKHFKKNHSLF